MTNKEEATNDKAVTKTIRGALLWLLAKINWNLKKNINYMVKRTCGVTAEVDVYVCFFVFNSIRFFNFQSPFSFIIVGFVGVIGLSQLFSMKYIFINTVFFLNCPVFFVARRDKPASCLTGFLACVIFENLMFPSFQMIWFKVTHSCEIISMFFSVVHIFLVNFIPFQQFLLHKNIFVHKF